ncbi:MAG: hypothetical protein WD669_10250 [Pirellulales bacterium]
MFENRISELFPQDPVPGGDHDIAAAPQSRHILPLVSIESIYQSAAARACRDHELDRLFNPDFYGDHGSGI